MTNSLSFSPVVAMPHLLDETYVAAEIERDHRFLHEELRTLTEEMNRKISEKDFPIWQFELIWRIRNLKNRLLRHFELEEQNSFRGEILVRSPENLKKILELKNEHGEITTEIALIVSEIRGADGIDSPRINESRKKLQLLFNLIRSHEEIESKIIGNTITEFKSAGCFLKTPTYSEKQVSEWEKTLNIRLPATYRMAVTSGSYDTANFRFLELHRSEEYPHLIAFASWNGTKFCFDSRFFLNGEYQIHVLSREQKPEKRYEDFPSWFQTIYQMATQTVNPD